MKQPRHPLIATTTTTTTTAASHTGAKKKCLYEVSFSLLFSSWCLLFLFYSRFRIGHGNQDLYLRVEQGTRNWNEVLLQPNATIIGHPNNSKSINCRRLGTLPHQEKNESDGAFGRSEVRTNLSQKEGRNKSSDGGETTSSKCLNSSQSRLDEFQNKTVQEKGGAAHGQLGNIIHRLEQGGMEYNYASSAKGAKVLSNNKEAKGAANILCRDRDKYLRNPCSTDGKFVVIELSEETLVDIIEIVNSEHYSSNFKEFELLGSLSYPTEEWNLLGNFFAENTKHPQRFMLPEPKWARYLRLNLINHYGGEFYCTLSYIEVYGTDAIERMLKDLIIAPEAPLAAEEVISIAKPRSSDKVEVTEQKKGVDPPDTSTETDKQKANILKIEVPDPVKEVRQTSGGRIPDGTVVKILMQKLRSLEVNLSVLEEYIKELNNRYGDTVPGFIKEISQNALILEKTRSEIRGIVQWKETVDKEFREMESWKSIVSLQLDALMSENILLRANIEKMLISQETLEKKELAVLAVSFFILCIAVFKLAVEGILMFLRGCEQEDWGKNMGWLSILVSSSMTTFIVLLYN